MSITSTNYTSLYYHDEDTPGITNPSTPIFQALPTTGGTVSGTTTTTVSEVIRRDRQIDDLVVTDQEVGGSINYEFSYGPYQPIVIALLQGEAGDNHTFDGNNTDITIADTGKTITSTAVDFTGILKGQFVRIKGSQFNDGVYLVDIDATSNVITLDSSYTLTDEGPVNDIFIHTNSYRNGANVDVESYTFMKWIEGIDAAVFMYYPGCQISSMNLNFATGSILGGSFNVVGRTEEVTETAKSGQDLQDVAAYRIMNSVSSLSIISSGLTAGTEFQSVDLTIDNNINAAKAIGTLGAVDLASFTLNVTANMSIYFEDKVTYDKFLQADAFSVSLIMDDGTGANGNYVIVHLPKCKFESLDTPIPGKDNFMMLDGSFRALRDATDVANDYTVQFDFISDAA